MYSNLQQGHASTAQGYTSTVPQSSVSKGTNPSISGTHRSAIDHLIECVAIADGLLARVRGAQPHEQSKVDTEMPSVMANASMINSLAASIALRLKELHEVIGE